MKVKASFLLSSLILLVSALGSVVAQTCTPGDDTCTSSNNRNNASPPPQQPKNHKRTITIDNLSKYRADIHYDDGRFGKVMQTISANGGTSTPIHTFVGHRFFVTMHGVREGLVDPMTEEQISFTVNDDDTDDDEHDGKKKFVIPKEATTSKTKCKDRYPVCKDEAARGECTNNPGWMIVNCCQSCDDKEGYGHFIDSEVRCTRERLNATQAAFDVGSLNDLFTRWATEEAFVQYEPNVISSPGKTHGAEYDGPWILTFDSFIDDEEIESLLEGAEYGGFQRSTDQGRVVGSSGEREKVVSTSRTSSNAWCRRE